MRGSCKHAQRRTAGTVRHVGWRADCFGDLRKTNVPEVPAGMGWNYTFDAYPKEIVQCGLTDAWRTAPVTMETCGNVTTWFLSDYDLDTVFREGYRYHMSVFMPKSAVFPAACREKLREFDKKLGIIGADGQPRVWFAIEGEPVDGWHALTSIDVL